MILWLAAIPNVLLLLAAGWILRRALTRSMPTSVAKEGVVGKAQIGPETERPHGAEETDQLRLVRRQDVAESPKNLPRVVWRERRRHSISPVAAAAFMAAHQTLPSPRKKHLGTRPAHENQSAAERE
jgi:hypothetical protein